jgi:hypothetical protein
VLAVVFASGVVVGYAVDSNAAPSPTALVEATAIGGEREEQRRRRGPVYQQIEGTEEQGAQIDIIVASHRQLMNELHADFDKAQAEYEANYDAILYRTRELIAQVFEGEQRAEYRRLLAAYDRAREAERAAEDSRK